VLFRTSHFNVLWEPYVPVRNNHNQTQLTEGSKAAGEPAFELLEDNKGLWNEFSVFLRFFFPFFLVKRVKLKSVISTDDVSKSRTDKVGVCLLHGPETTTLYLNDLPSRGLFLGRGKKTTNPVFRGISFVCVVKWVFYSDLAWNSSHEWWILEPRRTIWTNQGLQTCFSSHFFWYRNFCDFKRFWPFSFFEKTSILSS